MSVCIKHCITETVDGRGGGLLSFYYSHKAMYSHGPIKWVGAVGRTSRPLWIIANVHIEISWNKGWFKGGPGRLLQVFQPAMLRVITRPGTRLNNYAAAGISTTHKTVIKRPICETGAGLNKQQLCTEVSQTRDHNLSLGPGLLMTVLNKGWLCSSWDHPDSELLPWALLLLHDIIQYVY